MSGARRPRIAVIIEMYGTAGGSERFVQEVKDRLAATGRYEFHVFANRWMASHPDITSHKVPRVKFPRFLRPWVFTALAQRRIAAGAGATFMPVTAFLQDRCHEVFGELPGEWLVQAPGVDAGRFAPDPGNADGRVHAASLP